MNHYLIFLFRFTFHIYYRYRFHNVYLYFLSIISPYGPRLHSSSLGVEGKYWILSIKLVEIWIFTIGKINICNRNKNIFPWDWSRSDQLTMEYWILLIQILKRKHSPSTPSLWSKGSYSRNLWMWFSALIPFSSRPSIKILRVKTCRKTTIRTVAITKTSFMTIVFDKIAFEHYKTFIPVTVYFIKDKF